MLLTSDERHELDHFFRGGGERQVEDSMSFLELGERTAAKVFLNTSDTSRLTAAGKLLCARAGEKASRAVAEL